MTAHWLRKRGGAPYSYDVYLATSADQGETWSEPFRLYRDQTPTEHGFVSLFPWMDGQIGAIWLDGRSMGQTEKTGAMQIRFRTVDSATISSQSEVLDERVCSCCPTSASKTREGLILAYRDRSEKEIRDIAVLRFHNGQWLPPHIVYDDGWEISGCPVNGPSVSANQEKVVLAWFTREKINPGSKSPFRKTQEETSARPWP